MPIEEREFYEKLAEKLLETYDFWELLEASDLTQEEIIVLLLEQGMIDPELPHVV